MNRGAWWAAVHGVAKSWAQLSDFTFTFHFNELEKEIATHSSVLAWRIPGTGEAGGLPSMGSHRVGHDWSDLAAAAAVYTWASLVAQLVKNPPAMQETPVRFLGQEDPLKKGYSWPSLVAQTIKNTPAMQEIRILSLGWEDPLKKGTATYSSILAWRIPWTEEPGRLQSMESQRVGYDQATFTSLCL